MKKYGALVMIVVGFSACTGYLKNSANTWSGSDVPGHLYAMFSNLNGKQKFKADLKGVGQGYMIYKVEKQSGRLKLLIRSGDKVWIEQWVDPLSSDDLLLPSNQSYTVIFSGNNASGKFDIRYGIK